MIFARAPLRITLGGGGTDLPSYYSRFGGLIVSAAIDKYVYVCVNRPAADDLLRVKYSRYEEAVEPEQIKHDLVRPTLKLLAITRNVEITSIADVPAGTGLGSSGAYLIAMLIALHELKRERVPTHALAEFAAHVEIDLAQHAVGKQDHFLAAFGGITCLRIDLDGKVHVSPLEIGAEIAEELASRLLLFFTGLTRDAQTILGAQDQQTRQDDTEVLQSLHRTKEIGEEVKRLLEAGELDSFGKLLDDHWQIKKRRSQLISQPDVDVWYQKALAAGALGGKLVGAGGGGFLMLYCPPVARAKVREAMRLAGLREMRYGFDYEGAKIMANF